MRRNKEYDCDLSKISFSFKIGQKSYSFRSVCKDVWDSDSQPYESDWRRYVNGKRVDFGTYSEEKDLSDVSSAEYKKIVDMKSHGQHLTGYY